MTLRRAPTATKQPAAEGRLTSDSPGGALAPLSNTNTGGSYAGSRQTLRVG